MLQILIKTVVDDPPRPGSTRDDVPAEARRPDHGHAREESGSATARRAERRSSARVGKELDRERRSSLEPGHRSSRAASLQRHPHPRRRARAGCDLGALGTRRAVGGTLEEMLDGSLLVAYRSSGVAADDTANAARCALAFHVALPNASIAVATGRDRAGNRDAGSMLERLTLLAALPQRIEVDDVTAGFLDARFEITSEHGAFLLHRESDVGEEQRVLLGKRSPSSDEHVSSHPCSPSSRRASTSPLRARCW